MNTGALVALNDKWLDSASTVTTANTGGCTGTSVSLGSAVGSGFYTNWQPYGSWYYTTTERRPIRLTMAEVLRLKAAAKRDAKLKAVLAKFTDQIEVEVDFE